MNTSRRVPGSPNVQRPAGGLSQRRHRQSCKGHAHPCSSAAAPAPVPRPGESTVGREPLPVHPSARRPGPAPRRAGLQGSCCLPASGASAGPALLSFPPHLQLLTPVLTQVPQPPGPGAVMSTGRPCSGGGHQIPRAAAASANKRHQEVARPAPHCITRPSRSPASSLPPSPASVPKAAPIPKVLKPREECPPAEKPPPTATTQSTPSVRPGHWRDSRNALRRKLSPAMTSSTLEASTSGLRPFRRYSVEAHAVIRREATEKARWQRWLLGAEPGTGTPRAAATGRGRPGAQRVGQEAPGTLGGRRPSPVLQKRTKAREGAQLVKCRAQTLRQDPSPCLDAAPVSAPASHLTLLASTTPASSLFPSSTPRLL